MSVLSESVRGGVSSVGFSPDGLTAACLGGDRYHSLRVFRSLSGLWRSDAQQLGPARQVSPLAVEQLVFLSPGNDKFNPQSAASLGFSLVTAGQGPIRWWTISGLNLACCGPGGDPNDATNTNTNNTNTINTNTGMNAGGVKEGSVRVTALTSLHGDVIAGDSDGNLFVWQVNGKKERRGRRLMG